MKRRRRSVEEIEALCARLRESNLTQRQFAEEIGVSVGAVQQWLRRHRRTAQARVPRFVEAVPVHASTDSGDCRIELSAGIAVVCRSLPSPAYIVALVRGLRTP